MELEIRGVSKTYAMTGWRIGYTAVGAALAPLIKAMSKIQGQSTSNPTHVSQIATLAALTGPQECVGVMRKAFDERRIEMTKLLRAIPHVKCQEPKGAFYAFPDLSYYVGKKSHDGAVLHDDVNLAQAERLSFGVDEMRQHRHRPHRVTDYRPRGRGFQARDERRIRQSVQDRPQRHERHVESGAHQALVPFDGFELRLEQFGAALPVHVGVPRGQPTRPVVLD